MKHTNNRYISIIKQYPFLFCLLVSCIEFAVVADRIGTIYWTVDDLPMMLFPKGGILATEASPLIIFSNVIYGWYLLIMYKLLPFINVYTWNNVVLLIVALANIYYNVYVHSNLQKMVVAMLLCVPFCLQFFSVLSFNSTAAVLSVSALVSLYSYLRTSRKNFLIAFIFLVFAALLIRGFLVIGNLVLVFPILAFWFWKEQKRERIKLVVALLGIAVAHFSLSFFDNWYYKNVEHTFYSPETIQKDGAVFFDYRIIENISPEHKAELLNLFDMSENDAAMLRLNLTTPLLLEKISRVSNRVISQYHSYISKPFFNKKVFTMGEIRGEQSFLIYTFVVIILLIFGTAKNRVLLFLLSGVLLLWFLFGVLGSAYSFKAMHPQIILSVLFAYFGLMLLLSSDTSPVRPLLWVLYAYIFAYGSYEIYTDKKLNYDLRMPRRDPNTGKLQDSGILELLPNDGKTYLLYADEMINFNPFDSYDFFKNRPPLIHYAVFWSGHPAIMKSVPGFAENYDMTLVDNPNIMLFFRFGYSKESFELITQYYKEHYNVDVMFVPVGIFHQLRKK